MNALQFQKKLLGMQENMMNFAMSLTANRADAQDLTQDTTLKVLNSREKYVDNINFKGWVLTVMRNTFINDYHRIMRTHALIDVKTDISNLNMIDSGLMTPEVSFQVKEITRLIHGLNTELQTPFILFLNGYKYNEISHQLALPLGTVKSRIYFARKELRRLLKGYND
ncbi:RNA polymerase sigma factor [Parabacteroides sp. 52]|uniref:RNA polymerase sigma factor n=1 Tax=unclassified Parabacteroides TaxID=2649774 RepID=UPI0013D3F505|nr:MULTISPECIES: RNA polymerase sigma factor [unclassified Parabacteroides]MDH6533420.1 RNA polymerase sigma factor (sigma-70 family) [Parabacteroides sp. PM5-20]NDV54177.1 RNA polymerase sigma factor [Parabacteroides sp. 52]